MRENTGAIGLALFLTAAAFAQPAAQPQAVEKDPLVFDVASVKPGDCVPPNCGLVRPTVGVGGYHIAGATIRTIMTVAYTVTDRQITGGPAWMNSDRWDIEAKADRQRTSDELHVMLQHLLEERFHLKLRHENRQESVYSLSLAKDGPKFKSHDPDDKDYAPIGAQMVRAADSSICFGINGVNVTMDYLAFFLSRGQDRMIINQTGLTGRWDVRLQYIPDAAAMARGPDGAALNFSPDCETLAAALPKQLGLRMEAGKGPVPYLVVEGLEKPSEN